MSQSNLEHVLTFLDIFPILGKPPKDEGCRLWVGLLRFSSLIRIDGLSAMLCATTKCSGCRGRKEMECSGVRQCWMTDDECSVREGERASIQRAANECASCWDRNGRIFLRDGKQRRLCYPHFTYSKVRRRAFRKLKSEWVCSVWAP